MLRKPHADEDTKAKLFSMLRTKYVSDSQYYNEANLNKAEI
jgi:hypothetical protein